MKKYVMIVLAALALSACHKEKFDLKSESDAILHHGNVAMENAMSPQEAEDAMKLTMDSIVALLDAHMGETYSDTLFLNVYYGLSLEQRQQLFAKMPQAMKEGEEIAELHKIFLVEVATSEGNPYTDIVGLTLEGDELALSELVGQTEYVLLDFWASWCGPCRRLMPVLRDLHYRFNDKMEILSCSCDRDETAWRQAEFEERFPWPQIRENDNYPCSEKYGVTTIPTTILINKEGIIIARNPSEAELEEILLGE